MSFSEKNLFLHNDLTTDKFAHLTFSIINFDHIFIEKFPIEHYPLEELMDLQKERACGIC